MVSLSDGEWKLMNELWAKEPMTITQITAALKEETQWSKHTVITMLSRMEKKGAVTHTEGERAKLFKTAVEREEVVVEETIGFLEKVYNGSVSMMVNALVEKESLSKKEIDELYEILRRAEERC